MHGCYHYGVEPRVPLPPGLYLLQEKRRLNHCTYLKQFSANKSHPCLPVLWFKSVALLSDSSSTDSLHDRPPVCVTWGLSRHPRAAICSITNHVGKCGLVHWNFFPHGT